MTSHSPVLPLKPKFSAPHCVLVTGRWVLTLPDCYGGAKANLHLEMGAARITPAAPQCR